MKNPLPQDLSLEEADNRALADRLVNYADAVVAVAFLGFSGIGLAIADPDTRSSLEHVTHWIIAFNGLLGVVFSLLIRVLRGWEQDLRENLPRSQKYARYSRRMYLAKHGVIWVSIAQTVLILMAAS